MKPALDEVLARLSQAASRDFVRYWFDLRAKAAAPPGLPDRRDIDPVAIAHLLPKLWLWAYDAERGDFVNRLAGGEIIQMFQRNPRGMLLGDWMPRGIVGVARPRYRRVIDEPAICVASGTSYIAGDRRAWCERVMAPLTNGGAKPSVVFGLSVYLTTEFSIGPIEREETEAAFFPVG